MNHAPSPPPDWIDLALFLVTVLFAGIGGFAIAVGLMNLGAEAARRKGITRKVAITECAKKLGITRLRVHYLVGASMAVELLGDNQDRGGLGWATVSDFSKLIERHKDSDTPGQVIGRPGGLPLSCREVWRIIPECETEARGLFARAVRENWPRRRAVVEIGKVQNLATRKEAVRESVRKREQKKRETGTIRRKRLPEANRVGLPSSPSCRDRRIHNDDRQPESPRRQPAQFIASAKVASPGDVADMCIELIEASENPKAVVIRLRPLLDKVLQKKPAPAFAM